MDYGEIYNLEKYIFETVSTRFAENGFLSALDFFCIVVWKANRAKSKIARRLLRRGHPTLDDAVKALTGNIFSQPSHKERLRYLIVEWGFLLPMASAILTVLYPEAFTVYDYRVLHALKDCPPIKISRKFDLVWDQYQRYVESVRQSIPDDRSLRDKDRYLWGRSVYDQLQQDIQSNFRAVGTNVAGDDL